MVSLDYVKDFYSSGWVWFGSICDHSNCFIRRKDCTEDLYSVELGWGACMMEDVLQRAVNACSVRL